MAKIVRTRTYVHALNVTYFTGPVGVRYHPKGGKGAGKPKADRAIRKRKAAVYQPPKGLVPDPKGPVT